MKHEISEKFNDLFENLIESMVDPNYYINDTKPVYTLEECLNACQPKIINTIYNAHKLVETSDNPLNDKNIKDKTKFLKNNLIDMFKQYIEAVPPKIEKELVDITKGSIIKDPMIALLSYGFIYGFKDKNNTVYVMPKEFIQTFNEMYTKEFKKHKLESHIIRYTSLYIAINGFVPIYFLEDILKNTYELKYTQKELNDTLNSIGVRKYKNKYYTLINCDDQDHIEDLLKIKHQHSFYKLSLQEAEAYQMHITYILSSLKEIEEKYKISHEDTINLLIHIVEDSTIFKEDVINEFCEIYNLPEKANNEINKIFNEASELRYWDLNGRTRDEIEIEEVEKFLAIDKKPKDNKLKSWLKILPKEVHKEIESRFWFEKTPTIDDLAEEIISSFELDADEYDEFRLRNMEECHNTNHYTDIEIEEYQFGAAFLYKNKDKYEVYIPDEIMEVVKEKISEYEDYQEKDIEEYFVDYIYINGILEDKKVIELLKENHNIEVTKQELDRVAKENNIITIDKKYYSYLADIPIREAQMIVGLKNKFGKYKISTPEKAPREYFFEKEFEELCENKLSKEMTDEINQSITFQLKMGFGSINLIERVLDEEFDIPKNLQKQMLEIFKKHKNDIPIWIYNGYTIKEYNEIKKNNKKIGRNDPCPCGSGKKYKQCHGK